ncbi:MAG: sigma-70 family RNA polymerase sigma factor [Dyadobacter sp.]|uniref:RNA polymerase sigma factor n=1 Tax=Dyadobacter sp. TaxID=1914288 RepID=UPI0032652BF6
MDQHNAYDETLWNAFKKGDKGAFGQLYELHYRPLFGYGYKLLPDTAQIEDIIQDLFIQLWRTRQSLTDVHNVKFYLFRAIRRDIARLSEKRKRFQDIDVEHSFSDDSGTYFFEHEEQEKLLTHKLMGILRALPERQLEVVTLRFFENFGTEEIAAIMGISEKSVRNTMYKALTHLRENTHDLVPFMELLLLLSVLGELV